MKKKLSTAIIILTMLAGLSLLLYPTVSDLLKTIAYNRAIVDFQSTVEALDPEIYEELLADAEEYNADLASRDYIMLPFSREQQAYYDRQLKLADTDVMGYVVIPKINVSLPIYHGTSDTVLQNGAGHLEGSSLPVGGESSHSVLCAHRGLPSARLFTDLDRLTEGDTFTIRVLKEVLTYEVDNISTVLPDESAILQIEHGKDYCTLLTCTPYGVNSHRLLVRGHRVPTPADEIDTNPVQEDQNMKLLILAGIAAAVLIGLVILIICLLRKKRRRRKEQSPE